MRAESELHAVVSERCSVTACSPSAWGKMEVFYCQTHVSWAVPLLVPTLASFFHLRVRLGIEGI